MSFILFTIARFATIANGFSPMIAVSAGPDGKQDAETGKIPVTTAPHWSSQSSTLSLRMPSMLSDGSSSRVSRVFGWLS